MKIAILLEHDIEYYHGLDDEDIELINSEIDIDKYSSLQEACEDTVNDIEDDQAFCDAEWNFMHNYYDKKGFTDDDWAYVLACGYDYDQFQEE